MGSNNTHHIKYTRLRVRESIRQMARQLKSEQIITDNTIFLVMLTGGVWFASHLFDALGDLSNEIFFIKGHSYKDNARGQFEWDLVPNMDLKGRDVVIIDDICDSGETLKAAYEQFGEGVNSIIGLTLLKRLPCTLEIGMPVYSCIEDATKDYFVGCGLDDNGRGRLLPYVAIC